MSLKSRRHLAPAGGLSPIIATFFPTAGALTGTKCEIGTVDITQGWNVVTGGNPLTVTTPGFCRTSTYPASGNAGEDTLFTGTPITFGVVDFTDSTAFNGGPTFWLYGSGATGFGIRIACPLIGSDPTTPAVLYRVQLMTTPNLVQSSPVNSIVSAPVPANKQMSITLTATGWKAVLRGTIFTGNWNGTVNVPQAFGARLDCNNAAGDGNSINDMQLYT